MSSNWDLYLHIKTLQLLGLVCGRYHCQGEAKLTVDKWHEWQAWGTLALVQVVGVVMLVLGVLYADEIHFEDYNRTGHQYFVVHFECSWILLLFLYGYCFVTRQRNAQFLQRILKFHQECRREEAISPCFHRSCYMIYFCICLLCSLLYGGIFVPGELSLFIKIAYTFIFVITTWIEGILILMHLSIVKIMESSFRHLNNALKAICLSDSSDLKVVDIQQILVKRKELLTLCHVDLNRHYGIMLLQIMAFNVVTAPTGPFYLVSQLMEFRLILDIIIAFVTTFIWNLPWISIFLAMSVCGGVHKEASRTVQILLRAPIIKPKIYKIIDKFLWQNLRPKPVLDALGFFTLSRETVFKCLAYIMSFMMILVQFKDMENKIITYNKS